MDNKVLAVVAGEEITEQDLNDFMENVPQDQQAYRSNPQFRQQYLEQLTALRMFSKQGEELKLDETEEFKKIMEGARKDILAQLMVSETLKGITVTDEEAESYFDEFQKIAPNDIGKLLLAYQIEAAKDGDLNKMITILELYRKNEFEERWAYELAHLYHRAGRVKECVQLCNEIIL